MTRIRIYILAILMMAASGQFFITPPNVSADDHLSYARQRLLDKINEARQHPLETAAALGVSHAQILADLPELAELMSTALPPLTGNDALDAVARAHTMDMLESDYYGHDSLDETPWETRVQAAGFYAAPIGETLGMVGFQNYMDIDAAVDILFTYLFLDELDPARNEKRNLLDPDMTEIGIGLDAGQITLDLKSTNVYLLTIDFAGNSIFAQLTDPDRRAMSSQLIQLINQARAMPYQVAEAMGIDAAAVDNSRPEIADALAAGLAPLKADAALGTVAMNRVAAIKSDEDAVPEDENRTPDEQMIESGYWPVSWGETRLVSGAADAGSLDEAVNTLFKQLFLSALEPAAADAVDLLDPDIRDIGVAIDSAMEPGNGAEPGLVAVCEFATRGGQAERFVAGAVYEDTNGNDLYDAGEGIADRQVLVYGAGLHLKTDARGGFFSLMDSGYYWIILFSQDEELEIQTLDIESTGVWVPFRRGMDVAATPETGGT